ncbi:hypothetical protein [Candidatus Uabimicrobium amorphum]|uniref:Uncharacterized protein n=1 Tax=Uabimicrobium amorphum TaxID=2596890 RepID=A0A5S9IS84_UABAM|nr:hypothetical protein [Candidatus Uabimicrobium amorphum]BBM86210.1 hypothetical protein UABAM_04596 [Candidatus Uabimicrobium amorphum]
MKYIFILIFLCLVSRTLNAQNGLEESADRMDVDVEGTSMTFTDPLAAMNMKLKILEEKEKIVAEYLDIKQSEVPNNPAAKKIMKTLTEDIEKYSSNGLTEKKDTEINLKFYKHLRQHATNSLKHSYEKRETAEVFRFAGQYIKEWAEDVHTLDGHIPEEVGEALAKRVPWLYITLESAKLGGLVFEKGVEFINFVYGKTTIAGRQTKYDKVNNMVRHYVQKLKKYKKNITPSDIPFIPSKDAQYIISALKEDSKKNRQYIENLIKTQVGKMMSVTVAEHERTRGEIKNVGTLVVRTAQITNTKLDIISERQKVTNQMVLQLLKIKQKEQEDEQRKQTGELMANLRQRIDEYERMQIDNFEKSSYVLGSILNMADDPTLKKLGDRIVKVGKFSTNAVRIHRNAKTYISRYGEVGAAALSLDYAMLAVEIANVLMEKESVDEIVLKQLGIISEQIIQLSESMHRRFDVVDAKLTDIHQSTQRNFALLKKILINQEKILTKLSDIEKEIRSLQDRTTVLMDSFSARGQEEDQNELAKEFGNLSTGKDKFEEKITKIPANKVEYLIEAKEKYRNFLISCESMSLKKSVQSAYQTSQELDSVIDNILKDPQKKIPFKYWNVLIQEAKKKVGYNPDQEKYFDRILFGEYSKIPNIKAWDFGATYAVRAIAMYNNSYPNNQYEEKKDEYYKIFLNPSENEECYRILRVGKALDDFLKNFPSASLITKLLREYVEIYQTIEQQDFNYSKLADRSYLEELYNEENSNFNIDTFITDSIDTLDKPYAKHHPKQTLINEYKKYREQSISDIRQNRWILWQNVHDSNLKITSDYKEDFFSTLHCYELEKGQIRFGGQEDIRSVNIDQKLPQYIKTGIRLGLVHFPRLFFEFGHNSEVPKSLIKEGDRKSYYYSPYRHYYALGFGSSAPFYFMSARRSSFLKPIADSGFYFHRKKRFVDNFNHQINPTIVDAKTTLGEYMVVNNSATVQDEWYAKAEENIILSADKNGFNIPKHKKIILEAGNRIVLKPGFRCLGSLVARTKITTYTGVVAKRLEEHKDRYRIKSKLEELRKLLLDKRWEKGDSKLQQRLEDLDKKRELLRTYFKIFYPTYFQQQNNFLEKNRLINPEVVLQALNSLPGRDDIYYSFYFKNAANRDSLRPQFYKTSSPKVFENLWSNWQQRIDSCQKILEKAAQEKKGDHQVLSGSITSLIFLLNLYPNKELEEDKNHGLLFKQKNG